ncbi:MAG: glycoside hydrolase family 2 TIM barrel-domain containing protein [Candidatus Methanofastidiosia archaeon]|jgi:hypothetical protein
MPKKIILLLVAILACCISQPPESSLPESLPEFTSSQTRQTISLDGEWEFLPVANQLNIRQTKLKSWKKVQVPHFMYVDENENLHRAWYKRTFPKVEAPKVVISFESVNFRCIVYVNNQLVDEHIGGYLPFEIDITEYLKETNVLLIGVEDVTAVLKSDSLPDFFESTSNNILYPVGSGFRIFGLWQSVSLKTYPHVYIDDVVIITSYREHTIQLDVSITNESNMTKPVIVGNSIPQGIEFPEKSITIPPGETKSVHLVTTWDTPELWSPENPYLYILETTLSDNNGTTDTKKTRFGFREFWIQNQKFYLNGTPITFRGSSKHLLGPPWTGNHEKDAFETITRVKEVHSNVLRLHANPYPEVFLDTADEMGMLIIDESALWCLSSQYDLSSDEFWEHAQTHIKTLVTRDRNHPSLVIWSVENEILLCGGDKVSRCESELINLGDIIKGLDPTRPIMYEGDHDLPNADIINLHYPHEYPRWTHYPDEAYFLDRAVVVDSYPRKEFWWDSQNENDNEKPLYIGEFLWVPPVTPYPHTIFYGDLVFTDPELYRNKAKAAAWKMYVQAYRSQGVNGFCPWNVLEGGEYPTPLSEALKEVFQPVYVFIKEYPANFFSGQTIEQTIVVCNGSYHLQDITITWKTETNTGETQIHLEPTETTEFTIEFTAPHVEKKKQFEITIHTQYAQNSNTITKVYQVYPEESFSTSKKIALYDPVGKTKKILDQNNIVYTAVDTLTPDNTYDLLIVGYHALKESDTPTVNPSSYTGNVLVFEQETLAPFGLSCTDHVSSISFVRSPFLSVDDTNLQFWQSDNLVSKNDIAKPYGNYIPIIDSGGESGLEYTSLLQHCHKNGVVVFCQLLVTEKYHTEPMAHVLFKEIMEYSLEVNWSPQQLEVMGDTAFLDFLNVEYTAGDGDTDVLFVTEVAPSEYEYLQRIASEGGVVWLHGIDPGKIAQVFDINFYPLEYRNLPVLILQDEFTYGLSNQEFYWMGERQKWWTPLVFPAYTAMSCSVCTPLTDPCIIAKIDYGNGIFIIDTMDWSDKAKSARIVSVIFTHLGIPIKNPDMIIQAEIMDIEDVTLGERRNSFYAFYTNGYLGTQVYFAASGVYTFRVWGWGDIVGNTGAVIDIMIDGVPVGTIEIKDMGIYEISCYVGKGYHELGIAFTNDYYDPPKDRNVYIDKIEIIYMGSTIFVY